MQDVPPDALRQSDVMDPMRARAFEIALGQVPRIEPGTALPPFFHQLYFWDARPPSSLGRDGHPAVGGFIPDLGLPRRMWAGGALDFAAPLRAGRPAEKLSRIAEISRKTGRSGPLGFVTLVHEIRQEGRLCVTERQDLVYRADPDPDAPRPAAPQAPVDAETVVPVAFDSTLLFRYSALTFNGHRIHYDLDYARDVEGYAGLVVHGPLLAQLLMLEAARQGPLARFEFRATAPLMHGETAELCRRSDQMWVRGPGGRQCMSARVTWG